MTYRRATSIIIIVVTALVIGYDIFVFSNEETGDTISEVIHDWGVASPFIPYFGGILCGHFWSPLKRSQSYLVTIFVLLAAGILLLIIPNFTFKPLLCTLVGLIFGTYFWPVAVENVEHDN